MKKDDPLSLKSLLFDDGEAPATEKEGEGSLIEVREQIQTQLPKLKWPDASKELDKKIDSILNQPIDAMLVKTWSSYKGFQKYCDVEKYPPGKTVLTTLLEHTLSASFKPSVVLRVGGLDLARLELPIGMRLRIEGVILKIETGRIMGIQGGSLKGTGSLRFRLHVLRPKLPARDLFKAIEKKAVDRDIAVAIPFGDGIPIKPRLRRGSADGAQTTPGSGTKP